MFSFYLMFAIIPSIPWVFLVFLLAERKLTTGFSTVGWSKGLYGGILLFALSGFTAYCFGTTPPSELAGWGNGMALFWACGLGAVSSWIFVLLPVHEWVEVSLFFAQFVALSSVFGFLTVALMGGRWDRKHLFHLGGFAVAWAVILAGEAQIVVGRFWGWYPLLEFLP